LGSLVDRIELRPNQGKLEIDLNGDLAGILTLAGMKDSPFDQNNPSVQVEAVAGARFISRTYLDGVEKVRLGRIPLILKRSLHGGKS
jgi:hypothetical protein